MEANDYRHTEEIASVLSQDDHFVDASTHKVNSSLRTDHVLSPALLYIIFGMQTHLTKGDVLNMILLCQI